MTNSEIISRLRNLKGGDLTEKMAKVLLTDALHVIDSLRVELLESKKESVARANKNRLLEQQVSELEDELCCSRRDLDIALSDTNTKTHVSIGLDEGYFIKCESVEHRCRVEDFIDELYPDINSQKKNIVKL